MASEPERLELNRKKWDRWAGTLDKENWRTRFLRDGQRKTVALIQLKPGSNFLDIGCGTGYAVNLAARSVGGAGNFYGLDLSLKMIEKARENYKGNENFHFIQADSSSMPLESDYFDAIICTRAFHHYLQPEKVMSEIYRVLKPGGRFYILDPTTDTWFGKLVNRIGEILEPEHVKMYSTREFTTMFLAAGLKYVGTEVLRSIEKIQIAEK